MRARPSRRLLAPPCAQVRPLARRDPAHIKPTPSPQPCLLLWCLPESGQPFSPHVGNSRCLSQGPQLAEKAGLDAMTSDLCSSLAAEDTRQRLGAELWSEGWALLPSTLRVPAPWARVPELPGVRAPALLYLTVRHTVAADPHPLLLLSLCNCLSICVSVLACLAVCPVVTCFWEWCGIYWICILVYVFVHWAASV